MKIRAPAKINLRLRIVGKRRDGYHLIDSIMVAVSLFDELEIKKRRLKNLQRAAAPQVRVTCDHPLVPAGKKNLVYRAAALLLEEAQVVQPLDIHIRKVIPVGAGLGGGSTDAAAALVGLNRLLKLGFSPSHLEKIAASLGADVPFFIRARPCRARGVGEKLTPLKNMTPWWVVILYPGFVVSTAWAYSNAPQNLTKLPVNTSLYTLLTRLPDLLVNDLEAVTQKKYQQIKVMKDSLLTTGAVGALMSGSGSAVFGVFESREKASKAYKSFHRRDDVEVFLAQVISRPK